MLVVFSPLIARFESDRGLVRGDRGQRSLRDGVGEYFPNPAVLGTDESAQRLVTPARALGVEMLGTAVLVFVIFVLVDPRNAGSLGAMTPYFVSFTVALLIAVFGPLTQAGWNPARDLGPRLVSFLAGWAEIAIPGPAVGSGSTSLVRSWEGCWAAACAT